MTSTRHPFDLAALAAHLRLGVLALVAEILAFVGAGRLAAAFRRGMARTLTRMEQEAAGIVVLAALPHLAALPPGDLAGRRPGGAPHGFRRIGAAPNDMRAMKRRLFPRLRDLKARLARLDAILADVAAHAARLAPHIDRVPPATRLLAVAPPATPLTPRVAAVAAARADTS